MCSSLQKLPCRSREWNNPIVVVITLVIIISMDKALTFVAVLVLAVLGYFGYNALYKNSTDYKNLTYIVRDEPITLKNGVAITPASRGSESMITTRFFGNEVNGDINHDGKQDTVFYLTQSGGGSGTFFYVVAALSQPSGGRVGSNAIFLGDRIAPQNIDVLDGSVIVNYADRKSGEPFTVQPSVGVSKIYDVSSNKLVPAKNRI